MCKPILLDRNFKCCKCGKVIKRYDYYYTAMKDYSIYTIHTYCLDQPLMLLTKWFNNDTLDIQTTLF